MMDSAPEKLSEAFYLPPDDPWLFLGRFFAWGRSFGEKVIFLVKKKR